MAPRIMLTSFGYHDSGGGTIVPRHVAQELARRGWDVTVFHAAYLVGQEKKSPHRHRYQVFYWVIAVLMLVTLIAVVTLQLVRPHLMKDLEIIVLESALILEFAAYWVGQTIELWDSLDRRERLPEDARNRLAEGRTTRGLRGLKSELFEARTDHPRGQRLLRLL